MTIPPQHTLIPMVVMSSETIKLVTLFNYEIEMIKIGKLHSKGLEYNGDKLSNKKRSVKIYKPLL